MANQPPQKMPTYPNADFNCSHCQSVWQADYGEVAELRHNNPITCKNCHCELILTAQDLQTLNDRFKQAEQLSKKAVIFTIPYFMLCAALGFFYNSLVTIVMIIIGFFILMTMRRSLVKDGIDHYQLKPSQPTTDNQPTPPHTQKGKKKRKGKN